MDWDRVARDARAASRGTEPALADIDDLTPEERRELRRRVPARLQTIVDRAASEMNILSRNFDRLEIPKRDQRKYRTVNGIVSDNIVEQSALRDAISNKAPRALVFVDDFVSTGSSASEGVARLPEAVIEPLRRQSVRVGFVCVAGFEEGLKSIQNAFRAREIRARVHAGDTLSGGDRVFSPQSTFFTDETERTRAEEIVAREGKRLERSHPLGYENAQAAIVFDGSCPNNTLPILWAERGGWIPLFPRR
jgi:hypothetical protein